MSKGENLSVLYPAFCWCVCDLYSLWNLSGKVLCSEIQTPNNLDVRVLHCKLKNGPVVYFWFTYVFLWHIKKEQNFATLLDSPPESLQWSKQLRIQHCSEALLPFVIYRNYRIKIHHSITAWVTFLHKNEKITIMGCLTKTTVVWEPQSWLKALRQPVVAWSNCMDTGILNSRLCVGVTAAPLGGPKTFQNSYRRAFWSSRPGGMRISMATRAWHLDNSFTL